MGGWKGWDEVELEEGDGEGRVKYILLQHPIGLALLTVPRPVT